MGEVWTQKEVDAAITDYFRMLELELRGETFVKTARNLALRSQLDDRKPGSVERKHQNISAVLIELSFPYIFGYKPLGNAQKLLRETVAARLPEDGALLAAAAEAVSVEPSKQPLLRQLDQILVPVPSTKVRSNRVYSPPAVFDLPRLGVNYLEREAKNSKLGAAGEEFVMEYERSRLREAGKRSLAERIDRVSLSIGDGLGYDILSFETSGRERLIEVKTTSFGPMTPFFASTKEVTVSERRPSEFNLYRVFRYGHEAQLFVLEGSLRNSCILNPIQYRASLHSG